jgi:hypothetical protein
MLEVLMDEEGHSSDEGPEATGDDEIPHSESSRGKQIVYRRGPRYYNKEQQLELVLATQGLMHNDAHQDSNARSEEDVLLTRTKQTSGKIQCVWDGSERVLSLTKSVLRRRGESGNGQNIIAGRKENYTSKGCMCPSLKNVWN